MLKDDHLLTTIAAAHHAAADGSARTTCDYGGGAYIAETSDEGYEDFEFDDKGGEDANPEATHGAQNYVSLFMSTNAGRDEEKYDLPPAKRLRVAADDSGVESAVVGEEPGMPAMTTAAQTAALAYMSTNADRRDDNDELRRRSGRDLRLALRRPSALNAATKLSSPT
ncbi:hypothetical protein LTR08_002464 [Meristemomyces frigidus]|nr:hypothetical protein LTR08_002464 [Meristemomyces frigidus]